VISLGVQKLNDGEIAHYPAHNIRSKNSLLESFVIWISFIPTLLNTIKIYCSYNISGVISTGPGLCIAPMLFLRCMGIKIIFIETFCRFKHRSFTGLVMSKFANRFLIQNKELHPIYPNAEYCGRL